MFKAINVHVLLYHTLERLGMERNHHERFTNEIKHVMLLGDTDTGKSCLLQRIVYGVYQEADVLPTTGIDFKIKTVELGGKKIKLQIWDTAGQERFHTITTSYYRGAMGIMLVYDITNPKTFENISKWLRNIDEHANEDVEKMILGNKCDMENKRQVSKDRGEAIAREHGVPFLETSAKANINVETAFMDLAQAILNKSPSRESDPNRGVDIKKKDEGAKKSCC